MVFALGVEGGGATVVAVAATRVLSCRRRWRRRRQQRWHGADLKVAFTEVGLHLFRLSCTWCEDEGERGVKMRMSHGETRHNTAVCRRAALHFCHSKSRSIVRIVVTWAPGAERAAMGS